MAEKVRINFQKWLSLIFLVSIIAFLWASSFYLVTKAFALGIPTKSLPGQSDLMTLFFGASSLSLTLFSFFFAALGFIGWQSLKQSIGEGVETAMQDRLKSLQSEMRGRILNSVALFIGLQHSDPLRLEQDENKEYLAEAVQYSYEAYRLLEGIDITAKYMALNNFVYFSCLAGQDHRRGFLLESARTLKTVGEERNYSEAQLTYCRAILQFSSNPEEIADAYSTAVALLKVALTERQRREASFYIASLKGKLEAQGKR
jgi:ABC-type multidrug transport system fused ATPase/permease subunit